MTAIKSLNITDAMNISPEEIQALSVEDLQTLHSKLQDSKQRKAKRTLDIVSAQLKLRKAKAPKAKEEAKEEKVLVENSVKTIKKPSKPATKAPAKASAGKTPAKKEKASTKPAPKKKAESKAKSLDEMTKEELVAYVQALQEEKERETFPEVVEASDKIQYTQLKLDGVRAIQEAILENPMCLSLFADEKLDDKLTNFTVLYASSTILVLLDRTRHKDTTLTLPITSIKKEGKIDFGQDGKFDFRFYLREPIQVEKEEETEKEA